LAIAGIYAVTFPLSRGKIHLDGAGALGYGCSGAEVNDEQEESENTEDIPK
jgi:uncharacterized protein YcfJ